MGVTAQDWRLDEDAKAASRTGIAAARRALAALETSTQGQDAA
jgi:hypothetical protein